MPEAGEESRTQARNSLQQDSWVIIPLGDLQAGFLQPGKVISTPEVHPSFWKRFYRHQDKHRATKAWRLPLHHLATHIRVLLVAGFLPNAVEGPLEVRLGSCNKHVPPFQPLQPLQFTGWQQHCCHKLGHNWKECLTQQPSPYTLFLMLHPKLSVSAEAQPGEAQFDFLTTPRRVWGVRHICMNVWSGWSPMH